MIIKTHHIYNKVAALAVSSLLLASCNDFFDILPMNEVVLENYWTQKGDVTSVLNGCYEALEQPDVITRMGVWGEMRSENIKGGSDVPNEINEILKENLLPSNSMCNWSKFYDVINRCNVLCHYAPEVQAIDPNYTLTEMKANVAEATAIRALCYFYLVRTFRDVPYTTQPSIDDGQNYVLPATPFDAVLDSLIQDLERVKGAAARRHLVEEVSGSRILLPVDNTSRVTCWTIYALLADLYLWKGDWDNAIKNCDLVLDYKRRQYKDFVERAGVVSDIALFGDIPLLLERPLGSTTYGSAYNSIFGTGNSFESLFELFFASPQVVQNSWVGTYYYDRSRSTGRLSAWEGLLKEVPQGTNTMFNSKDCRAYESAGEGTSSSYIITKYSAQQVSFNTQNVKTMNDVKMNRAMRSSAYANWIIYRLSDVILMKAEALIEKGNDNFEQAFALINTVNKRALNVTPSSMSSDTLKMVNFVGSKKDMVDLLLEERHREFLFEGKRWYDLVRYSRREGNTTRLASNATQKYIQDLNVIKIKLSDPNYIYFPYSKNKLKVNPLLHQNPAFNKGEDAELN